MKLRATCLVFTALLLMGALAGATTDAPVLPMLAAAEPSPDCTTNASLAGLPDFDAVPTEQATFPCGSCSVAACQGKFIGEICAVLPGGQYYTCGVVNFCSAMGGGTGKFCDCPGNY